MKAKHGFAAAVDGHDGDSIKVHILYKKLSILAEDTQRFESFLHGFQIFQHCHRTDYLVDQFIKDSTQSEFLAELFKKLDDGGLLITAAPPANTLHALNWADVPDKVAITAQQHRIKQVPLINDAHFNSYLAQKVTKDWDESVKNKFETALKGYVKDINDKMEGFKDLFDNQIFIEAMNAA